MSALSGRSFLKMNGLGNEIVVLDLRGSPHKVSAQEARAIAQGPGSHFDQLMALHDPLTPGTEAFVRIYNVDGGESGACGNGARCVAWALMREHPEKAGARLWIETKAGLLSATREGPTQFTIDMGAPQLDWRDIPLARAFPDMDAITLEPVPLHPEIGKPSAVGMGNPHAIFFVEDARAIDLARIGPALENDPVFPEKANISFAQVLAPDSILLRVWERGAGATLACGSAACATLVAAARRGLTGRKAQVHLPGGALDLCWREADDHVLMTGPVAFEHEGALSPALFSGAA